MRKEWREFARDRRLLLSGLLLTVLALTAVVTSLQRVASYEADRLATEARDRKTWESQGNRNPHSAAHFASWALRPLTPLALIEPGVTAHAGSAVWMEAHSRNTAQARPVEDNANAFSPTEFSTAWLFQTIFPLLIAVISASAVAREREHGTLKTLLASGSTVLQLVPAKVAAVGLVIAALIAPVLLAAAVATSLAPSDGGQTLLLRLMLWGLAYAIYFSITVLLSIAISTQSKTVSSAILSLVGLWLVAVLMIPRAGAALAQVVVPAPTTEAFWSEISEDRAAQPNVFGKDAAQFEAKILAQYGVRSLDELPVSFAGLQLNEDERLGNLIFDEHFARLEAIYAKQRDVLRWLGALSPLPAMQNISMALAGTDLNHQLAFQDQAEHHRRALVAALNGDLIENGHAQDFDYLAGPQLWASTEAFHYQAPAVRTVLVSIWPDLLVLLAWSLAMFGVCWKACQRLAREMH